MIHGPKFKLCRRLGSGVFEKCQTAKFTSSEARHKKKVGGKRPKALSEFGSQLVEKQKIRFSYGVSEKQFSNYVKKATEVKNGSVADALFESLEQRLDNTVYRMGFAHTRALARQMVSHGHFLVNGVRTTVPSYAIKPGSKISVREGSRGSVMFADLAKKLNNYTFPVWLSVSPEKMEAEVKDKPKNKEGFLDFNTVLEFYSR